ncbi:hypothetical protein SAE02_68040 [Skermanella aerolata]|uniref:Uncharacterized protein n=1 Tax=Skermanella aerolata TaxID=393310 RepID=A0A512E1V6_9PROT|nr:hypothetical protein SAE02_68040 [Skermanella aerolata]
MSRFPKYGLPVLEGPEKQHLEFRSEVADGIEQQGAFVRIFERGWRHTALCGAEQFFRYGSGRQRVEAEPNQRPMAAQPSGMYLGDDIVFTDARFPGHQDGKSGGLCMLRAGNGPVEYCIPKLDILKNREERH